MNYDFTFLTLEQTFGYNPIEIIKKKGASAAISDFSILLGGDISSIFIVEDTGMVENRTSSYWTKSKGPLDSVDSVDCAMIASGSPYGVVERFMGARPALPFSSIQSISTIRVSGNDGILEVEFGEYPQKAVPRDFAAMLDRELSMGRLKETGKTYTTDSREYNDYDYKFEPQEHIEYEYKEKKYVRAQANSDAIGKLSNGEKYNKGDFVWVEVSPIKWYVDKQNDIALSKDVIFAGVQFNHTEDYNGDFRGTDIKKFMDKYFSRDIIPNITAKKTVTSETKKEGKNPYGLEFGPVSEEEIIHGAIESNVPVFLHGKPGEGKSARIKQIDPNCEVLSLGTLTPELLVGMALKDTAEKKVEYMAPPWFDRLVKTCNDEPDKIHILFLDELNNASPNMQKYAFSIALDRKVNDRFLLPDNVRIAAAGNEVEDSLSTYELAGPLYDRFAHVNIKTTPEQWLKWASENNIHPAVYTFIAYGGERVLRTETRGDKQTPTADPRKWEMASKMLYATKNPNMLRGVVGEELTTEFIEFCRQPVITVENVLSPDFDENELKNLNVAEAYATVMSLSYVDEENVETIRNAVSNLGPEYVNTFYSVWAHGDSDRLQKVAELQMTPSKQEGGHRR